MARVEGGSVRVGWPGAPGWTTTGVAGSPCCAEKTTTQTQRTQRLHREEIKLGHHYGFTLSQSSRCPKTMTKPEKTQARTGGETAPERFLDRHLGNVVHLFLSFLAILILAVAATATVVIIIRDVPLLWRASSEYDALHYVIQNVLLVAIAAELALLFLFHRTSAAVEVLIFVIARKMVVAGISGLDLLTGVAALAGLVAIRFYFIRGKEQKAEEAS